MTIELAGDDLLLWEHLQKGHKKTWPWTGFTGLADLVNESEFYEESDDEEVILSGIRGEMETWHNEHHTDHKDFLLHIMNPWSPRIRRSGE